MTDKLELETRQDTELRCKGCGKTLGKNLEGRVEVVCPRCKRYNVFETLVLRKTKTSPAGV